MNLLKCPNCGLKAIPIEPVENEKKAEKQKLDCSNCHSVYDRYELLKELLT